MPGGAERFFFSFLLFFLLSEEKALNLAAVIECNGVCMYCLVKGASKEAGISRANSV